MSLPADSLQKKFRPMLSKTLENAIAHRIGQEFPRLAGPLMRQLAAQVILKEVARHVRPREHVGHGQILWMAISKDDPPALGKRTADTDMIPVILDVSTPQDIKERLARRPFETIIEHKAVRLCQQAFAQGGLLSNCDLAEILGRDDTYISRALSAHEDRHQTMVPRRSTLHDVGSGLTHKRLICRKRYLEGKESEQIARETYHSIEAVDRYLKKYDQVRSCRLEGLTPENTAYILSCSVALVHEYLRIDDECAAKTKTERKND